MAETVERFLVFRISCCDLYLKLNLSKSSYHLVINMHQVVNRLKLMQPFSKSKLIRRKTIVEFDLLQPNFHISFLRNFWIHKNKKIRNNIHLFSLITQFHTIHTFHVKWLFNSTLNFIYLRCILFRRHLFEILYSFFSNN